MKQSSLLLLACFFLSGCPINERGYTTRWWNGETYTSDYKKEHIAKDGTYLKNIHKKQWYENLTQEQKKTYNKSVKICGKSYPSNIHDTDNERNRKRELAKKCFEELNSPRYLEPETGKYDY